MVSLIFDNKHKPKNYRATTFPAIVKYYFRKFSTFTTLQPKSVSTSSQKKAIPHLLVRHIDGRGDGRGRRADCGPGRLFLRVPPLHLRADGLDVGQPGRLEADDLAPVLEAPRHRQYVLLVLHVAQEDLVDALEDRVVIAVRPVDAVAQGDLVVQPVLVRVAVPVARGLVLVLVVRVDPRYSPVEGNRNKLIEMLRCV